MNFLRGHSAAKGLNQRKVMHKLVFTLEKKIPLGMRMKTSNFIELLKENKRTISSDTLTFLVR